MQPVMECLSIYASRRVMTAYIPFDIPFGIIVGCWLSKGQKNAGNHKELSAIMTRREIAVYQA